MSIQIIAPLIRQCRCGTLTKALASNNCYLINIPLKPTTQRNNGKKFVPSILL